MNQLPSLCPLCAGIGHFSFSGKDFLRAEASEFYHYYRCGECAAEYLHPMPDAQTIATFYPAEYNVHQEVDPKPVGDFRRAVLRLWHGYEHLPRCGFWMTLAAGFGGLFLYRNSHPYFADGRLLDVGCGNGTFLFRMKGLGWQVCGVDFTAQAVAACHRIGLDGVVQGDLRDAAFPDDHFDMITARHLIEHLPAPQPFLSEVRRILKPGGLLVIETPNALALGRRWFGMHWFANEVPRHLILYCNDNLTRLLSGYGLMRETGWAESSPKIVLNSMDLRWGEGVVPSRKVKWKRLLARLYVALSLTLGRGDILHMKFRKV